MNVTAIPKATDWISPDEYLEGERSAEVRHEYVDGHVYAMAGASDDHNRIAGNIFRELGNALRVARDRTDGSAGEGHSLPANTHR